jgi:ribosomal protein S27E
MKYTIELIDDGGGVTDTVRHAMRFICPDCGGHVAYNHAIKQHECEDCGKTYVEPKPTQDVTQ